LHHAELVLDECNVKLRSSKTSRHALRFVDTTAFEDLPACDDYTDSDEEEQEA